MVHSCLCRVVPSDQRSGIENTISFDLRLVSWVRHLDKDVQDIVKLIVPTSSCV